MKRWYYVEDTLNNANVPRNTFGGVFESKEIAIEAAEAEWSHLLPKERTGRQMAVYYADIPKHILREDAYDYICENDCGGYIVATFKEGYDADH